MNISALLKAVLEASWQGSLVILLILLLRPLLGLRVPARWRYLLWTLVLLRLLIPAFILPPSPASLQNLAIVDRPLETSGLIADSRAPARSSGSSLPRQGEEDAAVVSPESSVASSPPPTPRPWWKIAAAVWFSGSLLTALWIVSGMTRLHRRLRLDSAPVEPAVARIWDQCSERVFGLDYHQRRPRLAISGAVPSPALVGIFRPSLLLPREGCADLSATDWEHIFYHELAHYRRRDHWMQAFQLIALCAHWFNPLVWLGFRFLRADRELAADEWTLRQLSDRGPAAYGSTLLKMLSAQSPSHPFPGVVGIMEDGAQMKQRLRHIVAFVPRRLAGSLAGVMVVLALAAVVLGRQLETADMSLYEGLNPAEMLVAASRRGDLPVVKKLLSDGADINGQINTRSERTALTAAVAASQLETAKLLLERGADLNLKPEKSSAPVVIAMKKGWVEGTDFLLTKGAACDPEMKTAAQGDRAAIDRYLGTHPADFEKLKTLCEIASANGHAELFITLFDAARMLPGHGEWQIGNGAIVNAVARGHRTTAEEMFRREHGVHSEVIRFSAAAAYTPGMREWLQSRNFKVPEYSDGERLIDAAERDDVAEIRRLLQAGVDVHYRGESDWTPISKAATWGSARAVKLLLENHADPNTRKHAHSPLELAKTPEIADLLLAAGADLDFRIYGEHIISYCVSQGGTEMVKWFLDHGVDPKTAIDDGTLLFYVGNAEIARLLIDRGVDVNVRNKNGETALLMLARSGRDAAEPMRILLEQGADPNAKTNQGITALMNARDGASVEVLVEFGADLHASSDFGNVWTSNNGPAQSSRFEALLRHGLKIDAASGRFLLDQAIRSGQNEAAKFLLEHGVDPNVLHPQHPEWSTVMGMTIYGENYEAAKLLLDHGAKPDAWMVAAASTGRARLVRLFWEYGARNISELCYAVTQGAQTKELERVMSKGGPADPVDEVVSPLGAAAALGHLETVKFLVEHGADPNPKNHSPLVYAMNQGQAEVVAYLLDHGVKATPDLLQGVVNDSNPYPQEPPIENFNRIVKALLAHGALKDCPEEKAASILISAIVTRNPGGNPTVIQMLLDAGLNVHARTATPMYFGDAKPPENTTQSVLEVIPLAEKSGCWKIKPEVISLLQKAGEKPTPAR